MAVCADDPSGNKRVYMSYDENERAAYAAGDMVAAGLYHRLDQLTQALGEAVAEIEELKLELMRAESRADDLQIELDRAAS
jgi:DNA mismatch repair ATPase MutS